MPIIIRYTYLFIGFLLLVSCGRSSSKGCDPVVYAEPDDPELLHARNEAIKSLDYFISSFSEHHNDTNLNFSIKADFLDNGQHEHMWIDLQKIENDQFIGYLGNEPQIVKNIKYRDPVSISKSQIEDWLIVDSRTNQYEGGFSAKVFLQRNSK
jgi:uncharacterized protein YegJ (DUF2314 family)